MTPFSNFPVVSEIHQSHFLKKFSANAVIASSVLMLIVSISSTQALAIQSNPVAVNRVAMRTALVSGSGVQLSKILLPEYYDKENHPHKAAEDYFLNVLSTAEQVAKESAANSQCQSPGITSQRIMRLLLQYELSSVFLCRSRVLGSAIAPNDKHGLSEELFGIIRHFLTAINANQGTAFILEPVQTSKTYGAKPFNIVNQSAAKKLFLSSNENYDVTLNLRDNMLKVGEKSSHFKAQQLMGLAYGIDPINTDYYATFYSDYQLSKGASISISPPMLKKPENYPNIEKIFSKVNFNAITTKLLAQLKPSVSIRESLIAAYGAQHNTQCFKLPAWLFRDKPTIFYPKEEIAHAFLATFRKKIMLDVEKKFKQTDDSDLFEEIKMVAGNFLNFLDTHFPVHHIDDLIAPTTLTDGSLLRRCFKSCDPHMGQHQTVANLLADIRDLYAGDIRELYR